MMCDIIQVDIMFEDVDAKNYVGPYFGALDNLGWKSQCVRLLFGDVFQSFGYK